jgi:hypothetical protein
MIKETITFKPKQVVKSLMSVLTERAQIYESQRSTNHYELQA